MVVKDDFQMVTARTYPKMLHVQPTIKGDTFTISAPEMPKLSLSFVHLKSLDPITSSLWQQPIPTVDCGNEVASWLSRFILDTESGLRLVFFPYEKSKKNFKPGNSKYDTLAPIDGVKGSIHLQTINIKYSLHRIGCFT